MDKIEEVKKEIQQAWCDGDRNPKDKFGDFLSRASLRVCQLFEPEQAQPELLTDLREKIAVALYGKLGWNELQEQMRDYYRWRADNEILSLVTPLLAEGARKRIKEVVDWINHNYWTGLGSYTIPLKDWQAQLKKWGIE